MTKANSAATGAAFTVSGQLAKLVLQLFSVAVLSRLLAPDDFGLVAMTAVFVALGTLLRDFGLPTVALSAKRLSHQQASNLFWLALALSLSVAAAMTAASPFIVWLFEEPRLAGLVPAMALSVVLSGAAAQFQVQLARQLRFKRLVVSDVISQLLAVASATATAIAGWGYWALAIQAISASFFLLGITAVLSGWRPARPRRRAGSRALITSGAHFGAAQLLSFAAANTDTLVIGAMWGAGPLGYYNRAFQLLSMPTQSMLAPLTNVVVPTLNGLSGPPQKVDHALLRIQTLLGAILVAVFMIAGATAPQLIPLVLGDGWGATIPIFQVLAVGGAVQAFSFVSYWAFVAHGASRPLLNYNLVTKSATIVAIVVGAQHGALGVAIAYAASLAASWPVNLWWLSRAINQRSSVFFVNAARLLMCAGLGAFVGGVTLDCATEWGALNAVIAASVAALIAYVAAFALTPGGIAEIKAATGVVRFALRRH